ncbi:hypothetical protein C4D60_Mb07t18390 [Musa balbisiana]|uniref:Ribosomal protein L37 n=1 Tax=Musa balbisiana TaxID=52838 RepID=A0A4S8JI68_MUSBA|nr:hypothetical protein C4D60_Mb07t18390 [Musa balbisiana]
MKNLGHRIEAALLGFSASWRRLGLTPSFVYSGRSQPSIWAPAAVALEARVLSRAPPMGKGTGSFGKRRNKTHTLCVRCGRRSFHLQKSRCGACGYPSSRIRKCALSTPQLECEGYPKEDDGNWEDEAPPPRATPLQEQLPRRCASSPKEEVRGCGIAVVCGRRDRYCASTVNHFGCARMDFICLIFMEFHWELCIMKLKDCLWHLYSVT